MGDWASTLKGSQGIRDNRQSTVGSGDPLR